jgi:hypothetical protein
MSSAPEQPQQDLLESNVSSNKVDQQQQQQQQQQREPKRYKFKSKTDFIGKVSSGGDNTQTQADEDEEDEANENSKPVSEPTTVAALEIGMTIQERLDYKTLLGKIRNEYNS